MPQFLNLFINGNLGCFHTVAIINNATVNMQCIYLFEFMFSFSLGKYPEVELLDDIVVTF